MSASFSQAGKPIDIAITDATIVDPVRGTQERGGVIIRSGKIAEIGPSISPENASRDCEVIDGEGMLLFPALTDMQVHTGEPGGEHKDTLATATQAAAAGGIGRIVAMPDTHPPADSAAALTYLQQRAAATAYVEVLAYGCLTAGRDGQTLAEMGLLKEAGAAGFTDAPRAIGDARLMQRALIYANHLGLPVLVHAEDARLTEGGQMHEGAVSTRLGLQGIPRSAETVAIARDLLLAEETGAQLHILQLSTAGGVGLVREAKARGVRVTCGVSPLHLLMTDQSLEGYRTFAKLSPPLRAESDRKALLEALRDGTIDVITSAHRPYEQDNKRLPVTSAAAGAIGLETLLPCLLQIAAQEGIALPSLLAKVTVNPCTILGLKAGGIAKGEPANLTLVDADAGWEASPAAFHSKSHNTPLDGQKLQGRAILTMLKGCIVYRQDTA